MSTLIQKIEQWQQRHPIINSLLTWQLGVYDKAHAKDAEHSKSIKGTIEIDVPYIPRVDFEAAILIMRAKRAGYCIKA